MKKWVEYLGIASLSAIFTCAVYHPVSLALYRIREPYFRYPIKPDSKKIIVRNDQRGDGEFGAKRRNGRFHSGIDMSAPVGTPVYASRSGIAFRGIVPTGYGKYIMIYHADGTQTIYGHLSNWNISPVQKVRQGDIIGFVGKTGNASSKVIDAHLHFEIRKDGAPQDPKRLLR